MWYPLLTDSQNRPGNGQLLAYKHAVWKVVEVEDVPLSEDDRELWLDRGMPDLDTWPGRPYKMTLEWVGGAEPPWFKEGNSHRRGTVTIPASRYGSVSWRVYRDGRWPQCSCCGEPMPCRAELQERQVAAGMDRIARLEAVLPGACWACTEPVTSRQDSVTYPGENLDLPGGQEPVFHTRGKCSGSARRYEEKWVSADPRRERILTWPRCDGILVVHADGSSECASGRDPLGQHRESQPDCRGHLTHDHGTIRACYVHENYFQNGWEKGRCPRGCDPANHCGTNVAQRPKRRQPSIGWLF